MLNGTIDLHIHSTCSDGLDTPEELVDIALSKGFEAISITDHDTVEGANRAIEAARDKDIEVIPGVELSAFDKDQDIHILAYYVDCNEPEFKDSIKLFTDKRRERAEEIVKCLNHLGLDVSFDNVLKIAHGAPIGRPHIAEALLSGNLVYTYNEAFVRYIGKNRPAYVPKYKISPKDTIELVLRNGGVPVLAHPGILNRDEYIPEMLEYGLKGLEVVHPLHSPEKITYYENLARKYGLIETGGSDWHGEARLRGYAYQQETMKAHKDSISRLKEASRNGK